MKHTLLVTALLGLHLSAQSQTRVKPPGEAPDAPTSHRLFLPTTPAGPECMKAVASSDFVSVSLMHAEDFNELPELAKGDGKPCGELGCLAPHMDGGKNRDTGLHEGYNWPSKRRQQGAYEQQTYVDPLFKGLGLQPFSVKDGILSITARRAADEHTGDALFGGVFTSGLLSTHQRYAQQYGYFEIRAKLPSGADQLPAFWMLPIDRSWPPEIDIMENMVENQISQGSHWVANNASKQSSCKTSFPKYDEGMHTYGALWTPERIVYYIDNVLIGQIQTKPAQHQPFYMMVNLAIGGNYVGFVGRTDPWYPRTMEVDYIAAYSDGAKNCTKSTDSVNKMMTCK
ncbi:glycoside hydrolase family 16 protein [Massilia antarctica]|uniref:glycoside hydrolase family 16 protein n=1 Tax=Massilia antarctica TaxID=2765360 RepID=UPI0022718CEE|nr:glycoside hydrolase family 16 protein [Massilia sp. H27-R4]MCY0916540.1 glycoside hydrolase family 16 protein [Massilia sp. H27-R4]